MTRERFAAETITATQTTPGCLKEGNITRPNRDYCDVFGPGMRPNLSGR